MFAMNTYQEFHSLNPPLIKRNIKKTAVTGQIP